MKIRCVFDSVVGYNTIVRLGKIYIIEKEHYMYLMNTNADLIDFKFVFLRFFKICKSKLKQKIFLFMLSHKDLWLREIGVHNVPRLIDKYYKHYFAIK